MFKPLLLAAALLAVLPAGARAETIGFREIHLAERPPRGAISAALDRISVLLPDAGGVALSRMTGDARGRSFMLAAALLAGPPGGLHAATIGALDMLLPETPEDRAVSAMLWYPAVAGGKAETVGENAAFLGMSVTRDAALEPGLRRLVVLSHGYGGSWRNLSWLAGELAGQGYIVVAPNHPGTTTFDRRPVEAARLWERPRDLSRIIDAVLADERFAGSVDRNRIAAIGHSLGGWTVAALAGARFDVDRFAADCRENSSPRACSLTAELGLNATGEPRRMLEGNLGDPRVKAVVSLDLGLARGFSPESLAAIEVPALVIAAGTDIGDMPAALESGALANGLPSASSRYVVVPDAMHFSFMQLCKPGAVELIEEETPGDGIVCKDGGTRDRAAIHRELADRIVAFLDVSLR